MNFQKRDGVHKKQEYVYEEKRRARKMSETKKVSSTKLVLVAMGAVMLMVSSAIVSNSTSYFITSVTEELSISRAAFSVYYTIISITTAIGSVLCGTLIPKIGNRRAFLIGTVGVTAGFLVLSRLTSLPMVYAGAILIGFCQAFIVVPPVSVVNTWFPKNHNGLVMGLTMAGTGMGGIIMAQVMPRVVMNVSWRTGYLVCAIMFFVLTLIANAMCGGDAPESEKEEDSLEDTPKKKESLDMSKVLSVAFIFMVLGCMSKCFSSVFNQHYSAHLQDNFGTEQIALAMTVFNIVLIIMKISMGTIYDKLKYKGMLIAIFITSFGYFGWASDNFTIVLLATVPVMFCCSADTVSSPLFLNEAFGKKFASAAWGICWGALYVGNALGSIMWGALYDTFGSYNLGLRLEPVMVGISCILWFTAVTIGKKKYNHLDEE